MIASILCAALAASPTLKAAEQAEADLEFDKAETLYQKVLDEPGTRDERIRAYKGLGLAMAIQGESKPARAAFEKLLMLDPEATVDTSMGPKISRPFEQAKHAVANKHNAMNIERAADGQVTAWVTEDVPMASTVRLSVREKGSGRFSSQSAPASRRVSMPFPPEAALEAYAEALDAHEGVVNVEASPEHPRAFAAVKVVEAVQVASTDARRESAKEGTAPHHLDTGLDEEEPSRWPVYVGIGAAVVLGAAVAVAVTQNHSLNLPASDRTVTLPAR